MVAVFIVSHVGGGEHQVSLLAQLGHQFGSLLYGAAEFNVLHVRRVAEFLRVVSGQPHDGDAHPAQVKHLVGRKQTLAVAIDVGRQHGKCRQLALHGKDGRVFVELVVAYRHGVVAQQVHAFEVGHGILHVGFWHSGVDVTAVQQQRVATG